MADHWRPTSEPARTIYDALVAETLSRPSRSVDEWVEAERNAVWAASRDYAQKHGLDVPTIAAVLKAEQSACGHTDYCAKWAYGMAAHISSSRSHNAPLTEQS